MDAESRSHPNGAWGEWLDHAEKQVKESSLSGDFSPNGQTWQIFKGQFLKLFGTLLFLALFITTLVLWERNIVSLDSKIWFNTIMTILNLALGVNFFGAFKDMAKVLRWRVLAKTRFTPRQVDLILGGDSLIKLGSLTLNSFKYPRKPMVGLLCVFWISLNILAQATVAMLSLNYSMDSGTNSTGIYTQDGSVNASILECYTIRQQCPTSLGAPMITAHAYGELVHGQQQCTYDDDADIFNADQSCDYFRKTSVADVEFAYRYTEYNPSDAVGAYPYLTNRTIRASADQCYQYDINFNHDASPIIDDTDGTNDAQVFTFSNGTYTGHLPIPRSEGAENSTTYIYNGSAIPQRDTFTACGPRCLTIFVYRFSFDPTQSHMYSCQITISEVSNATEDWHHVSNDNARLAAASIALTGRYTNPAVGISWRQYQLYTWYSYLEVYNNDAQYVGANLAQFAIGSLANMANLNGRVIRPGIQPILGYHLDTDWTWIIALAVSIGVAHCLLVAGMLWIARPVVVLDNSDLSTARLLHGLVGRLGGRGSLLDGKRLAEEIQKKINHEPRPEASEQGEGGGAQVIYGIREAHDWGAQRVLDLGVDVMAKSELENKKFPPGRYA